MNRQIQSTILTIMLSMALLLSPIPGVVRASQHAIANVPPGQPVPAVGLLESLEGISGASTDWWAAVQEEIRQSEYHVTWQERTYLADIESAYQAPNRAHNLRAYFTPAGVRLIPRVFEGETPPWEWGLTLTGYGYADGVQPVAAASLRNNDNRIEYERGLLTEWYVNDERCLEQGFTLHAPPHGEGEGRIVLDLVLSGNLSPHLQDGGSAIEFTPPPSTSSGHSGGVVVLRYGDLLVTDAAGRQLPARFELAPGLRIAFDATSALYPITVDPSITGLAPDPAWTAESDQAEAGFGSSVGTAGDVNGDGYSDVIVGAPWHDNGEENEGRAFVYHGAATGLASDPDWTAEGDQADARFGSSVGMAGDVNGDGYSDVIVGADYYDNDEENEGRAFVYHGAATGLASDPAWMAESDQVNAYFGRSVGTAGDVNGDGYSDVIIGAWKYDNSQADEGRAYVYHGAAAGLNPSPAWIAESDQADAWFGFSVGTAGDVNGDGYSDVIVGADYYDNDEENEGRAFVYHGAATGLAPNPTWTAESNQVDALFGWSVGSAGDVNGDGYSDVIVSASCYYTSLIFGGRAYVYHGAATGLDPSPAWTAEGDQYYGHFGYSVGTTGDVNGDGYSDVIVGEIGYQWNGGRAYVFHGTLTGLGANPAWTAEGDQDDALFGASVGTAGDVNGDGYSDVIVGAPWYDSGEENEGRAYVYYGNGGVGNQPPVADAGADQVVDLNATVTLDSSGSYDPDGNLPLTYLWSQTGGPTVTLSDPTVISPTFSAPPDPAVLTFTLAVTDSLGMPNLTPDEVVITVQAYHVYLPLVVRPH